MPKKYCPLCKQTLNRVYSVSEMEAEWDSIEGFYLPVESKDFLEYDKCMKCGTIVHEKGRKAPKPLNVKDKLPIRGKIKSGC